MKLINQYLKLLASLAILHSHSLVHINRTLLKIFFSEPKLFTNYIHFIIFHFKSFLSDKLGFQYCFSPLTLITITNTEAPSLRCRGSRCVAEAPGLCIFLHILNSPLQIQRLLLCVAEAPGLCTFLHILNSPRPLTEFLHGFQLALVSLFRVERNDYFLTRWSENIFVNIKGFKFVRSL